MVDFEGVEDEVVNDVGDACCLFFRRVYGTDMCADHLTWKRGVLAKYVLHRAQSASI